MLEKMPGEPDDKFKNLKAAYAFMFCHPGKKLLFMGQEFGQLREWSEERELDWFLLGEEKHRDLKDFVQTLAEDVSQISCACMERTRIRLALSGSMRMTGTEVFTAS